MEALVATTARERLGEARHRKNTGTIGCDDGPLECPFLADIVEKLGQLTIHRAVSAVLQ
jgi:hypothetical protein